MGWFSKKAFPSLDTLLDEDSWQVAQGEHDGKPMIVRINETAKQFEGHPDLPVRMGIAIPLRSPRPDGLPNEIEQAQLTEIEDRLFAIIGKAGRVVLVISTSGMREFVSYVRSEADAARFAEAVRSGTRTHEVQNYAAADPKWQLFGTMS